MMARIASRLGSTMCFIGFIRVLDLIWPSTPTVTSVGLTFVVAAFLLAFGRLFAE